MKWFVIHPNGARYGPADAEELRQWLDEKRAKPGLLVEDAETGAQSTVAEVLGLTPEIEIPDLSLDIISDDAAPSTPSPTPTEWPATSSAFESASILTGSGTDEPQNLSWPSATSEPIRPEVRIVEAEPPAVEPKIVWPEPSAANAPPVKIKPQKQDQPQGQKPKPKKMSKAPRNSSAPLDKKKTALVGQSYIISTIGLIVLCCLPLSVIGMVLADKARKENEKGAVGALIYGLAVSLVSVVFWISTLSST